MNATDTKPKSKAEREVEEKTKRRAEEATIVAGMRQALDSDEQLLGFARGRLAGGIRGKLSLGPEAFFAPFVNIGLTERRLVIQHINAETGRPGEILPHYYALGDIAAIHFSDIETFGGESAARLTVRLKNEQHTRIRLRGQHNLANAQAIVEVYRSLTEARRPQTTPTQRVCATCQHILDQPFKFCPYCGQQQDLSATATNPPPAAVAEPERTYPPTPPGPTEPDFLDTVPYQDAEVFRGPTVEDGLEFLAPTPVEPVTPESEASAPSEPQTISEFAPEQEAPPAVNADFQSPVHEAETPVAESTPFGEEALAEPAVTEAAPPAHETSVHTEEATAFTPEALETEAVAPAFETSDFTASPLHAPTDTHFTPETVAPAFDAEVGAVAESAETIGSAFLTEGQSPVSFADPMPLETGFTAPSLAVSEFATPTQEVVTPEFAPSPEPVAEVPPLVAVPVPEPPSEGHREAETGFMSEGAPSSVPEHAPAVPVEAAAPAIGHESAGFVTVSPEPEPVPTTLQDFDPFAPISSLPNAEAPAETPLETVPAVPPVAFPITPPNPTAEAVSAVETPTPEPSVPPLAPPVVPEAAAAPAEDRFAKLLREVRGEEPAGGKPMPEPPKVERRDGPMSVRVHISRPRLTVNETFTGRNAEEIVTKLKGRVLPELNFGLRLLVSNFSSLRFAQEIVRRYNEAEKTNLPVPNSCWEFLLRAEEMGYADIMLNA